MRLIDAVHLLDTIEYIVAEVLKEWKEYEFSFSAQLVQYFAIRSGELRSTKL